MNLRTVKKASILLIGITIVVLLTILKPNIGSLLPTTESVPIHKDDEKGTYRRDIKHLSSDIRDKIRTLMLFIGYPRSGHTLIGSLLDAHPNMVIANEFNMLERWRNWTVEEQTARNLFDKLYENSYQQYAHGFRSENKLKGRSYAIPNQWQGTYKDFIQVIGDKKGGKNTQVLAQDGTILEDISRTVKLPIKFIHVVRNPFDNIATMVLRALKIKTSRDELAKNPINDTKSLMSSAKHYITIAKTNNRLVNLFGNDILTLHSENVIKNPKGVLKKLCRFLEVTCTKDYLRDCEAIVYRRPSKSRLTLVWPKHIKDLVLTTIALIPFLNNYSFDV